VSTARSLVFDALLRAARIDGPARLIARAAGGAVPGLFPVSRLHLIPQAVPQWLHEEPRGANQTRWVRLTGAGIEVLLEETAPEERCALVWSVSVLYQRVFLRRWLFLLQTRGWSADRPEWERCADALSGDFRFPGPGEDQAPADFHHQMARELTLSWKHAANAEVREGIARAMRGVGLHPIGVAGERVVFAGSLHTSGEPMFPGDAAVVIEPGWRMHDGSGDYLLEKARVGPV
jgi:hypothetical protein